MSGRRVAAACDRRQLPRGMGSMAAPLLDPRPLRLPFLEADVSRAGLRGGRRWGRSSACGTWKQGGRPCRRPEPFARPAAPGGRAKRSFRSPASGVAVSRWHRAGAPRPRHKDPRRPAADALSSRPHTPTGGAGRPYTRPRAAVRPARAAAPPAAAGPEPRGEGAADSR